MTHICVGNLTIIGSDNGLSPGRRQAIIWTNAWISLMEPLGINFSEIVIEILIFSFKKMRLKVSSAKWRPFCLGLNELKHWSLNWWPLVLTPKSGDNEFEFYIQNKELSVRMCGMRVALCRRRQSHSGVMPLMVYLYYIYEANDTSIYVQWLWCIDNPLTMEMIDIRNW